MSQTFSAPPPYTTSLSNHLVISSTERIAPPSDAPLENQTSGKYIKTWSLNHQKK